MIHFLMFEVLSHRQCTIIISFAFQMNVNIKFTIIEKLKFE